MTWTTAHEDQYQSNLRAFLAGAVGVLEATPCELSYVYRRCSETDRRWSENLSGHLITVGYLNERPICISLRQIDIEGHKVIVYHATSTLVDWSMIRAWLESNMPDSAFEFVNGKARLNATDADNWSHVLPRKEVAE
jgi:hypothetical protein